MEAKFGKTHNEERHIPFLFLIMLIFWLSTPPIHTPPLNSTWKSKSDTHLCYKLPNGDLKSTFWPDVQLLVNFEEKKVGSFCHHRDETD